MKTFLSCLFLILTISLNAQIHFTEGGKQHTAGFHSGVAVMVTDANGDGRDDIVRLFDGDRVTVTLQGQDGRFFSSYFYQISGSEQWNITGGDIDNDGHLDIVTSGAYDRVKIFRSMPFSSDYAAGTINDATFFAQSSNLVDIDCDGFLDLFVCNDDQKSVIFMNDQAGNLVRSDTIIDFTTATPSDNSGNYGSIWTDIDSDGDLDLYISKCRQGVNNPADPRRINALYLNNGDHTYTESADSFHLAIGAQSWTADFGDIDNDGDFDCFITNHDVPGMLLENIDNAYFQNITDSSGVVALGIAMQGTFRDFDNDGLLDLIVSGTNNYLYRNVGGKRFEKVENPFSERPITSYGIGDLNSDGFLDVYATYNNLFNDPHPILNDIIWMNEGNDNHWFSIHLKGTTGNTSAVGARLYLYGDWGMQTREVHAGEGYGITNSFTQYFGLGAATTVDSLAIIWPCGERDVYENLSSNTPYYLEQGNCMTSLLDIGSGPFTQCTITQSTFTAPDGYAAYLWNDGTTAQQVSTFEPGIFHVSLTDDQGCTWIAGPLTLSPKRDVEPDTVIIEIDGRPKSCAGAELVLSGPGDAISWQWSSGDTTQVIIPTESGEYILNAVYECNTFQTAPLQVEFYDPNDIELVNDTLLGGGIGELYVAGDSILWYSDPDGIDQVATGNVYVTEELDTTQTYYVQETTTIEGEQYTAGQKDHTGLTMYNSNNSNGAMRFDVLNKFRIDSVLVITEFEGKRTIIITDDFDNLYYQQTFDIDSGRTYLPLNVWLEPQFDYLMTTVRDTNVASFGVGSPRLFRSDREFIYPFTVQDVLSINGTATSQQFYYYFYDWHITRESQYCTGDLLPIQVVVVDTTSSATVTQGVESLRLSPNPVDDILTLSNPDVISTASHVVVLDARGAEVSGWQFEGSYGRMNVSALPEGMYFIRILSDKKTFIGQFVKM